MAAKCERTKEYGRACTNTPYDNCDKCGTNVCKEHSKNVGSPYDELTRCLVCVRKYGSSRT